MEQQRRRGPWVFTALAVILFLVTSHPPAHGQTGNEAQIAAAIESSLRLTRDQRRLVQGALTARGYDVGPLDGLFGRRTRAAIRRWQLATGVAVTGHLDRRAVETLLASSRPNRAEDLRAAEYLSRIAAAGALEDPRRRATALLAIVLEAVAIGDLTRAREAARRINDPTRRTRAFERIANAEGALSDLEIDGTRRSTNSRHNSDIEWK